MKELVNRAFSLGLGMIVEGKEQIEKAVDELVKKGEVSKEESKEIVQNMIDKGEALKEQLEVIIKNKLDDRHKDQGEALKEELQALRARIDKLEEQLKS